MTGKIVCAWCGRQIGHSTTALHSDSHGCCHRCAERITRHGLTSSVLRECDPVVGRHLLTVRYEATDQGELTVLRVWVLRHGRAREVDPAGLGARLRKLIEDRCDADLRELAQRLQEEADEHRWMDLSGWAGQTEKGV